MDFDSLLLPVVTVLNYLRRALQRSRRGFDKLTSDEERPRESRPDISINF